MAPAIISPRHPNGDPTTPQKDATHTTTTELQLSPGHTKPPMYTLNDILIHNCMSIPDIPLIGYPTSASTAENFKYYTATELDRFANGAIGYLQRNGLPPAERSSEKSPVVALLGPADLDYIVTIFALTRMGFAVLFLSTRLSVEACLKLLDETECEHVIHASLPALEKKVVEIESENPMIKVLTIPGSSSYIHCAEGSDLRYTGTAEASAKTAFIIHSSGSTGFPKPIFTSHRAGISNYSVAKGFQSYFLTLPLYHGHGISTLFRAVIKGKPIAVYNATLPLTGGYLLKGLQSVNPESFHCVPYALKLLAEVQNGPEALARTKQVLFGGSSCPDELGDYLVKRGVRLISHYGATELGQLMTSDRPIDDNAWNYVRPMPNTAPYLRFDPLDDGSYECVALDGLPAKVTSNSNYPPYSFRTRDCFLKHPRIPNAWKYLGRLDDRVTLMNGEKVLPIPIEHRIRQNRLVKDVLVVGVGRLFPGLLVIPNENAQGLDKAHMLAAIWPDIAAANSNAEAFSQVSKDMVEILDVGTWYPATDKGTITRKACYTYFALLIDRMYDRASGSDAADGTDTTARKLALSAAGIEEFLLGVMQRDLGLKNIDADTDFFAAGMDSLQAIQAQGIVKRTLDLGNGSLGQNAFFDFGNIKNVARHLEELRTGVGKETESEVDVMAELIQRYSDFRKPTHDDPEVVLLTGVTGSLGCYVLSKLLQKQSVRRIFCLVRASSPDAALDRVVYTLTAREQPLTHISKIRALPSDLSRPDLGFGVEVIEELRSTLTKVIHSAWAVNFNIGVRSFEQQHIAGVHNLINLCLSSRKQNTPEFYFCSSISSAAGTPLPARIAETPVPELAHAHPMGYARSKLVAERIVQAAAERTGITAKVLRVGQIVGDTVKGKWNPTEAIPLMLQTAVTMGALPALDETPSWTPVDVVAQAILELSALDTPEEDKAPIVKRNASDPSVIYHLANSKVFHWTQDLLPAIRDAGLQFEAVSQREWIRRLREGEQDPKKNPAVKLIDFFAGKYDNEGSRKGLMYETTKTEEASPALRGGVELISSGLIKKFVNSWKKDWGVAEA